MENNAKKWLLHEQCGREWRDELIYYPVCWNMGEQMSAELALANSNGILPSQLCDIIRYPDGSMRSASVWCMVSLQPFEKMELTLINTKLDLPTLLWQQNDNGFVAENGDCKVQIPASGSYPLGTAPGPIISIAAADDKWFGRGFVDAEDTLQVKVELREAGPLLLRWQYRAYYERRTLITVDATLFRGANFVHLREESSYDSELTFFFDAFPGLEPDKLVHHGGGEYNGLVLETVDYARPEQICVIDFHSGHQQMSNSWFGLFKLGESPLIGAVEMQGQLWTNCSVNRLHLFANPPVSLLIASPWQGGVKSWALVCSTAANNLKENDSRECIELSKIHQRYTEVPLQKVKDWCLEWPEEKNPRPLLQCSTEGINIARKKVADSVELTQAYQALSSEIAQGNNVGSGSMSSTLTTLWVALGDDKFALSAVSALEKEMDSAVETIWNEGALMRMIIFHGRSMKMWLQVYDILHPAGWINETLALKLRRHFAFLAYGMSDPEQFPKQHNLSDMLDPDSFYQGLGERIGDSMCPPNFHTEYFTTYGMMGCNFPGHPQAVQWRNEAKILTEKMLEVHFYDSGAYSESVNYHAHTFVMLVQFALALRQYGDDLFQHPRMKSQFDYFNRLQTPPILLNEAARKFFKAYRVLDNQRERYAMLPGNGNSGSDCSDMPMPVELALGGVIYRDSDPELSARCVTSWRRGGRFIMNTYDDLTFLLLADIDLPGCDNLQLHSELFTGDFVTFRANAESTDEVMVLTKNGTATHHNDFDEGGFSIWAYGAPVASDFGYHAHHQGRQHGVGDSWKHNCVEFDEKSSGYLGMELTSAPEEWYTGELADLLVSNLSCNNLRDLTTMTYMDRIAIAPIEYRRYTLFVKPGYLLIFDSIISCQYNHRWWLHSQANEVIIEGAAARFSGKFGVDLVAHFISPEAPKITAGEFANMKHIFAQQSQAKDWRVLVAPLKEEQSFAVTAASAGRVITVETADYTDTIFLSHFPFTFADKQIEFSGRVGIVRRSGDGIEEQLLAGDLLQVK